jgi:DNA polymerase epsilon subunit 1
MQVHKRVVDKPITEVREAGICMRENSFYVDIVRRSVQCLLYPYSSLFLTCISSGIFPLLRLR